MNKQTDLFGGEKLVPKKIDVAHEVRRIMAENEPKEPVEGLRVFLAEHFPSVPPENAATITSADRAFRNAFENRSKFFE